MKPGTELFMVYIQKCMGGGGGEGGGDLGEEGVGVTLKGVTLNLSML